MITPNNIDIKQEENILNMHLKMQTNFKKSILIYMDKIANNAISSFNSSAGGIAYNYLNKVKKMLYKTNENIEKINKIISELNKYSTELNDYDLTHFITSYNEIYTTYMKTVLQNNLDFQNSLNDLLDYIKFDFSSFSKTDLLNNLSSQTIVQEPLTQEKISTAETSSIKATESKENKENVLIISDIQQKVILPYYVSELENILKENSSYENIQEIIDKKYTIPISYYKNPSIARFKEAYSLVKKRSHGSTKDAFDLGLELFFKFDLNPAIITACKNIDELDIYLSCLDDNELDDFKCFDIIYESFPTVQ